jgi:hypothetical protein
VALHSATDLSGPGRLAMLCGLLCDKMEERLRTDPEPWHLLQEWSGIGTAVLEQLPLSQYSKAVPLNSPGGSTWTGVQIGLAIHRYKFATAVADGTRCSSSCAIAWLGGAERFMGNGARIGFHSPRHANIPDPSPDGNAILGAYYYQIGITSFDTIIKLTRTHPQSMLWIKPEIFRYLGIDVKPLAFNEKQWLWAGTELGTRRYERIQATLRLLASREPMRRNDIQLATGGGLDARAPPRR